MVLGVGRLEETGDPWEPYRLLDADGSVVLPAAEFLAELQAQDSSVSTLRSYGNDLLLWWRWLAAAGVAWDKVTPAEGRDFARWMQVADKPARPHWRDRDGSPPGVSRGPVTAGPAAGTVNPVTGKASPGRKLSASSRAHAETVLRRFYDFHLESGRGPIMNPFPLDRSRRRAGLTRTATRWSRSATSGRAATGPGSPGASPGGSPMSSSIRSSPG